MNANIMKTQIIHKIKNDLGGHKGHHIFPRYTFCFTPNHFIIIIYDLNCHFYVMENFCDFNTVRPFDLITTFTYVLMDNFCPSYLYFSGSLCFKTN